MMGSLWLMCACLLALDPLVFAQLDDLWSNGPPQIPRAHQGELQWEGQWDGPMVKSGQTFSVLPHTSRSAVRQNWTKVKECNSNARFQGSSYRKDSDLSLVLLYNGARARNLAGVQCVIAKAGLPNNYPPRSQIGNIFQDDGDRYLLTVYFNNPYMICEDSKGPLHELFPDELGLYIQTGSNPFLQNIYIPFYEHALRNSNWKKTRRCINGNVSYYSYNMHKDMSCDDFLPVFVMFNETKLFGFGWALGVHQTSDHFEHPPIFKVSDYIKPKPKCWDASYPSQSSMHIYMTVKPICP